MYSEKMQKFVDEIIEGRLSDAKDTLTTEMNSKVDEYIDGIEIDKGE